jgi:adenine-specific DNA-methyltransferase
LLRSLFQFELSDLDFGIYRLFRIKQDELKAFIDRQLPETVDRAFAGVAGSDIRTLTAEVSRLAELVRTQIDPDALLDNGGIKEEFRDTRAKAIKELVLDYETRKAKLDAVRVTEEQKLDVFNHLFNFFSRYYDAGDFIPKRFYGGRDRYAVPYSGAETYFHWANKDQHYVKTAEAFRDYAFTAEALGGPFRVRFVITAANVPKDNTKGDRRYFFPLPADAAYDGQTKTFRLPFHYRLPTATEVKGGNGPSAGEEEDDGQPKRLNGDKLQDAVLQAALPDVLAAVPEPALAGALGEVVNREAMESGGAEPVSLLLKRCRHFTRRNTSDYFIHKNLQKFLTEELEFYIKDQILHIGDLEGDFEGKRRMLRAFRQVAADLIAFLAQIEDVQLRLFEKRKFVLRADYLVTVANVPKPLRKEILDPQRGAKQLAEWKRLYAFDECAELLGWKGKLTEAFLERHPTLAVNTANFDAEFRDLLLESIQDLESVTDGLLVNSENYQALRLLERGLYERVKCVYIDPPYNTGSDEFIYKDAYRHSSWLAMIKGRLTLGRRLLAEDGSIFVSIDDNEVGNLRDVMDEVFGVENFVATVIWQKVFSPKSSARHFSEDHDFLVVFARRGELWRPSLLPRTEEANARYDNPDEDPRGPWTSGDLTARNYYSEGQYEVTSRSGKTFRPVMGTYWRVSFPRFQELDRDKRIWWGPNGDNMPRLKRFLSEVKQGLVPQTLWPYEEVGHTQEAKQELLDVVRFERNEDVLNTVKPPRLIQRVFQVGTKSDADCVVVDFFAGSGTTGDAAIRQSREDGARRRFVLVEMGGYFDDIVMQRIQRVMSLPEWDHCRPKRVPTAEETARSPRLVKVLRLESYEDAIHNLTADDTLGRSDVRAAAYAATVGADAYRLQYLARLPLAESASMLQLDKLEHPFDYTLEILTDAGPQTQPVDLVETFNYLLGLDVQRLETWQNAKDKQQGQPRRYRIVKGHDRRGKRVLVVWRDMTELDPKAEREFLEARLKREEAFDRLLINGDSATPGFESLDGLFKQLMTE